MGSCVTTDEWAPNIVSVNGICTISKKTKLVAMKSSCFLPSPMWNDSHPSFKENGCAARPVAGVIQLMDDLGSRCQMVEELAAQRDQGLVLCFMKLSMIKRSTTPYQRQGS